VGVCFRTNRSPRLPLIMLRTLNEARSLAIEAAIASQLFSCHPLTDFWLYRWLDDGDGGFVGVTLVESGVPLIQLEALR